MGFSVTGFIIAVILFAPNLIILKFPPENAPEGATDASILFVVLERIGQVGCLVLLSVLKDNFKQLTLNVWLVLMFVCIIVYYCLWIRYIVLGHQFSLLFKPLAMIPIPMAIFPVLAFAAAAMVGRSIWLGIAVVLLAIGHFVNSWHTYKAAEQTRS